ncbi:hypothetical protein KAM344_36470 [Aeromonas caviae]|nr:hypothetical protein KAM344_36470 [Aeromonas caviae]
MAVGEVSLKNLGTVLKKEISTGLLISAAIALAAWVRAWSLGGARDRHGGDPDHRRHLKCERGLPPT